MGVGRGQAVDDRSRRGIGRLCRRGDRLVGEPKVLDIGERIGPVRRSGPQILHGRDARAIGGHQILGPIAIVDRRIVAGSAVKAVVAAVAVEAIVAAAPRELVAEVAADQLLGCVGPRACHRRVGQLSVDDIRCASAIIRPGADLAGEDHVVQAVSIHVPGGRHRSDLVRSADDLETVRPVHAGQVEISGKAGGLAVDQIDGAALVAPQTRNDDVIKAVTVDVAGRSD